MYFSSENITFNWMRNDNLPMPRDHYITIRKYACISMLNGREVFRVIAYRNVTGKKMLFIAFFFTELFSGLIFNCLLLHKEFKFSIFLRGN
jgi:hypothetical protein